MSGLYSLAGSIAMAGQKGRLGLYSTESTAPDEEQPADHTHSPDPPSPNPPEECTTSSASIIGRSLVQGESGDPCAQGADDLQDDSATQPEVHF